MNLMTAVTSNTYVPELNFWMDFIEYSQKTCVCIITINYYYILIATLILILMHVM